MKDKKIVVPSGDNDCPADALMLDFRKNLEKEFGEKYPQNIEVTPNTLEFWKEHADIVKDGENNKTFQWYEIPEEELPPLKISVFKENNGNWRVSYLKEYGEDQLLIQGKQGKGSNKNGRIILDKYDESQDRKRDRGAVK